MTAREAKLAAFAALGPLLVAGAALANAYASRITAETEARKAIQQQQEKFELSDSFQAYIQSVMKGEECLPCEER